MSLHQTALDRITVLQDYQKAALDNILATIANSPWDIKQNKPNRDVKIELALNKFWCRILGARDIDYDDRLNRQLLCLRLDKEWVLAHMNEYLALELLRTGHVYGIPAEIVSNMGCTVVVYNRHMADQEVADVPTSDCP